MESKIEAMYSKIFDDSLRKNSLKLEASLLDPNFNIENIKAELEALYVYEGQDWSGRGELFYSDLRGSITAYEIFIKKWNTNNISQ